MSFTTVKGIEVPASKSLLEQHEVRQRDDQSLHVKFNVSAEKLDRLFESFVLEIAEPGFLVIEVPCNQSKELELRKSDADPYHKDIYYLDALSRFEFLRLYSEYSDIFINDGSTHFGYGAHNEREEIFVGSYKIFHLYTADIGRYKGILNRFGISETDHLVTAWNTFTRDAPGVRSRWTNDGLDIYEVIEQLMRNHRLYLAETVEE